MNRKGLSLVEMLAVLAVLSIIALIIVPITIGTMRKNKKDTLESTTTNIINSAKLYYANNAANELKAYTFDLTDMKTFNELDIKGKVPDEGKLVITEDGEISLAIRNGNLCANKTFDDRQIVITENCTSLDTSKVKDYTALGEIVYFDPVDANSTCDKEVFNVASVKDGGSTCYKWRIIGKKDDKYTLQLDHNIVNTSAWASSGSTTGPTIALSALATATSSWNNTPLLNYEYDTTAATNNYGVLTCEEGTCKITKNSTTTQIATNLRARIITGEEVRALTMNAGAASGSDADKWTLESSSNYGFYFSNSDYILGTKTSGTGSTNLSWLIENTNADTSSGATVNIYDNKNYGYWTLSIYSNATTSIWGLWNTGCFQYPGYANQNIGIRPVIEIDKSKINFDI